jgi:hypothetical protein
MDDFYENKNKIQILTDTGWSDFAGLASKGIKETVKLITTSSHLTCTTDHEIFLEGMIQIKAIDIKVGDHITCNSSELEKVSSISVNKEEVVYDLIDVEKNHRFFANNLLIKNCEFVTDSETLIDNIFLSENFEGRDELFKMNEIRWYSDLEPNKTYLIGLDPSVGTGGDAAAIEVFQLPEMIQVAEWRHNKTPIVGQIRILLQILRYIDQTLRGTKEQKGAPEIYWTIENNGIGEHAIGTIDETGEDLFPGIFVHEPKRRGRTGGRRKGMSTTNKVKVAACSKFKSLVETGRIEIYSRMLVRELKFYVRSGEGFSAKWGETDDLISATLLIIRLMTILQNWDPNVTESLKDDADADDNEYLDPLPVLV